jgi:hypothetical protein
MVSIPLKINIRIMKSASLLFASVFAISSIVSGQAREAKIAYQRTQQPAAVIELPYSKSVVETAIENYLSSKGAKGNESKGFKTFRNVRLEDTVSNDMYFKVERKSQNESTVYLFLAPVNENVTTRAAETDYGIQQAKSVLNDLAPSAEASNLDVQLKDQQEEVSKAEKRLRNLMDDGAELSRRKANIEEKIIENNQQQEKQKVEIERQRQQLNVLMNKKRS